MVQYMFLDHAPGISVLISVAGFYSLYFYAIKGRLGGFEPWEGQNKAGWFLLAPVVLIALTYTLFANKLFHTLNLLALPICMAMQTIVLSRNSKHAWYHATFLAGSVEALLWQADRLFVCTFRDDQSLAAK